MKITTSSLVVEYGRLRALDRVSLRIYSGEVTVLTGPNGAGKSTLLGVLLGLIAPSQGEVRADDKLIAAPGHFAPVWFRRQIGFLPEAVAFSENMSGRQVLNFFARARAVPRTRVESVLGWLGLEKAASRRVGTYSRGMRQRLGLGVAVLTEPDVLVMDEPTGGLDQQGLSLLWEVFEQWKHAGRTVVISSHELSLIERRASKVHIFTEGELRASGTPTQLRVQSGLPKEMRVGPGLDEVYEAILRGEKCLVSPSP